MSKRLAALALTLAATAGCSDRLSILQRPNTPPAVRLEASVVGRSADGAFQYGMRWTGEDADGRVIRYLYALDPHSIEHVDASWRSTTDVERSIVFPPHAGATGQRAHVFAIRAVDDRGDVSEPQWVAFIGDSVPPSVRLVNPTPSTLLTPILPPNPRFTWSGSDPDGKFTAYPIKYKYILLGPSSQGPNGESLHPDSVAADPGRIPRIFAPSFPGWDSTSAETTSVRYANLTPSVTYMFIVVAFDETGLHSVDFSLRTNMLRFRVGFAKTLGPEITVGTDGFRYTFRRGYSIDPAGYARIQVPSGQPITFWWIASASEASTLRGFRWALDPVDPFDETPRSGPDDLRRWSERSLNVQSVTLGPYTGGVKGETHRLFIEAQDSFELRSLAVVEFTVVPFSLTRDLLVVDDTRLEPDNLDIRNPGCFRTPIIGPWPNAAELDTFLFARGGHPWRCYPAGTMSSPGLFSGYDFDTIGTRGLATVTVPLATLRRYRHVVWIVDYFGAQHRDPPNSPRDPTSAMRWMSERGRMNTLSQYCLGGGRLWVLGGGAALAASLPWNSTANDLNGRVVFSSITLPRDLVPGMFMHDTEAWQSEFATVRNRIFVNRYRGRFEGGPTHADLPASLSYRSQATDTLPAFRRPSDYYLTVAPVEFLQRENYLFEDLDPGDGYDEQSTLDTLMAATGGGLPLPSENPHNVVMTVYHGPRIPQGTVFSGFDLWTFRRPECRQIVDYVLQRLWGLTPSKSPVAHAGDTRPSSAGLPARRPRR